MEDNGWASEDACTFIESIFRRKGKGSLLIEESYEEKIFKRKDGKNTGEPKRKCQSRKTITHGDFLKPKQKHKNL